MKYELKTIKEIFNKYKVIHVPYYQREYVWGTKNDGRNLYKFIDDIFTQYNTHQEENYFIGTLAFCSSKVNDVIDGQQRITSLILILSILAQLKCSDEIKNENAKILEPSNNTFVIQEENYLTEEIKHCLGLQNNFNSQHFNVNLSKTYDRIASQIQHGWNEYTKEWYDGLYHYILNKVTFISLEYNTISESLKYFLNINSLSIQLTQSDIFFSILSQSLRISESTHNIFTIKQKIKDLGEKQGLGRDIDEYKSYLQGEDKGIVNIIYIFLNAYYQNDKDIIALNTTGVGKWMSFYKNEVFTNQIKAKEFSDNFVQFIKDLDCVYRYFSNSLENKKLDNKSSLCTSWLLLQYEGYFDLLKFLICVFKQRHNYIPEQENLYSDDLLSISIDKLNEIAKRLNLTLISNYIKNSNKRLDGFITNISFDKDHRYKKQISDIVSDIDISSIFNLNYNDKKNVSKIKIKDESRQIKVIMSLQEAFLNTIADGENDLNDYLSDLLSNKFSIEHLYSVLEHNDKDRLENWQNKKNMFHEDSDFDSERFSFANLSLLDLNTNASANDDDIYKKLSKYKNAKRVLGSHQEYLIQSLVEDSEFYRNTNISALGLPKRTIQNIDQNTWQHSENNRDFNIKLLKMALELIASK